ncbi:MAG: hypothetical protein M3362_00410 [Acidobacteriota bacterium]|nr:hypothetical protein [Acidobacteriota bacterium]
MSRNASQPNQGGYVKAGFYVALVTLIVTFVGVSIAYLAWQYPKSPFEPNKLVAKEATPTPTPVLTPTPIPIPSPTPNTETSKRKPTKKHRPQEPADDRCYLQDEEGNYVADEEGYRIEVDCETGEEIQP